MTGYFELKHTSNNEFLFNLHAGNNEIILTSESYRSKSGALNGIDSVRTNAPLDERYQRETSGNQYYFVLKAANHETIGRSELYTSTAGRENGIESVKRNAPEAKLRDLTQEKVLGAS